MVDRAIGMIDACISCVLTQPVLTALTLASPLPVNIEPQS